MIRLNHGDYEKIVTHARNSFPNESCGLIAGTVNGDERSIEEVYLLTNLDASPEHFSMDPKEQLAAVKSARCKGFAIIGNFHSHPVTPSRPSEEDIRLARDPASSYLILSLQQKDFPVLNSFRVQEGLVTKEDLFID